MKFDANELDALVIHFDYNNGINRERERETEYRMAVGNLEVLNLSGRFMYILKPQNHRDHTTFWHLTEIKSLLVFWDY